MNESYNRKKVKDGRAFLNIVESIGFNEVYLARLKLRLELADKKVHDKRMHSENGRYYLGLYDGIKEAIDEKELILNEMKVALAELKASNLNIDD